MRRTFGTTASISRPRKLQLNPPPAASDWLATKAAFAPYQANYCLISPQLLKARPFQQPVFKHCCCRRTHTVEAQSGRPPLAAQTTPHRPNIPVQLTPVVVCRFREFSGSRRSGAIAATASSEVVFGSAFGCLISAGSATFRSLVFSDPGLSRSAVDFSGETELAFGVAATLGESIDHSERQGRGVSLRTPAPRDPSSLITIL
jgi:hypothetical protein